MIKTILFDWHGVLDKRKFQGIEEMISSWKGTLHSDSKKDLETFGQDYARGILPSYILWENLKKKFDLNRNLINELKEYITGTEINQELWSFLPELKQRYTLGVLSDCPSEKKTLILSSHFNDISLFDKTFWSCDYRLLKSDPKFFFIALNGLNTTPNQCLFVDDSEKNTKYAQELEIHTHVYRSFEDFKEFIKEFNPS